MTLSRNPSQPRGGPDQTRPPSTRPTPVFITGIGLCCQAGTEPFALFGAVGTNLSGARAHACLEAPLPEKEANPRYCTPPYPD